MSLIKRDLIKVPKLNNKLLYEVLYVKASKMFVDSYIYLIDLSDDYKSVNLGFGWIFPQMFGNDIPPELSYLKGRYCMWVYTRDNPEKVGHIE